MRKSKKWSLYYLRGIKFKNIAKYGIVKFEYRTILKNRKGFHSFAVENIPNPGIGIQ